jgi:hypothetical protein
MGVLYYLEQAHFVATIKVLKVKQDSTNSDYHQVKIQINELFKGDSTTHLKLQSRLHSSCGFLIPENTEWLVFAEKNANGELEFNSCSGQENLNFPYSRQDSFNYPNLYKNYQNSVNRKLAMLRLLKSKQINPNNEYNLGLSVPRYFKDTLKGYTLPDASIAVYRIKVNTDLSIASIKTVQSFPNKEMRKRMMQIFKNDLKVVAPNKQTSILKPTELILDYYYYAKEGIHQSFISPRDL